MHAQSYGFKWGEPGDTVRVISSRTMENVPGEYVIESISPVGQASDICAIKSVTARGV